MQASSYGHHDVVRTLLEVGAGVNAKANVRNQNYNEFLMIKIILNITI